MKILSEDVSRAWHLLFGVTFAFYLTSVSAIAQTNTINGFSPNPVTGLNPHPVSGFSPNAVGGFNPHPVTGFSPSPANGFNPHPTTGFQPNPVTGLNQNPVSGFNSGLTFGVSNFPGFVPPMQTTNFVRNPASQVIVTGALPPAAQVITNSTVNTNVFFQPPAITNIVTNSINPF